MQLKRNKGMEFEVLKKSHKKQIIIGALAVCVIGGALTFNLTRAKYKLTQEIPLAKGVVNYKVPDMRIVALYTENDNGEYIENNDVPTSGYTINNEKSMCKVYDGTTSIEDAPKDNNITIEYTNGEINVNHLTKKNTRCYLYFDKYIPPITMDNIIASLNAKSTVPNFASTATSDEGVYSVSDGMYGGTSYYWRGAATTNYVKFAGFCWRIVRINGDKTMRLIYDGTTCHANGTNDANSIAKTSIAYNTSYNKSYYVGWTQNGTQRTTGGTASNAKTQLESWYGANITGTNAQKVASGKYCNDRDVGKNSSGVQGTWSTNGSTFYYAGYYRLYYDYKPTLSCPSGDVYELSVGLITADEVEFAGGKNANNSSYYLYNGQNYWTMSPRSWNGNAQVFFVDSNGCLNDDWFNLGNTYGLRPVINLKADTLFKVGGTGTQSNPYEVQ